HTSAHPCAVPLSGADRDSASNTWEHNRMNKSVARSVRTSPEIVECYLAFFSARGHLALPAGGVVAPETTTLFVIAGMQPLMPYLRGQHEPPAPRLVGIQRCLRTDDVELVGTNGRKNSAFHMLGNWSIGDYGRRGAMELALELIGELGVERS